MTANVSGRGGGCECGGPCAAGGGCGSGSCGCGRTPADAGDARVLFSGEVHVEHPDVPEPERAFEVEEGGETDACPLCGIHRRYAGYHAETCGESLGAPGCFVVPASPSGDAPPSGDAGR